MDREIAIYDHPTWDLMDCQAVHSLREACRHGDKIGASTIMLCNEIYYKAGSKWKKAQADYWVHRPDK